MGKIGYRRFAKMFARAMEILQKDTAANAIRVTKEQGLPRDPKIANCVKSAVENPDNSSKLLTEAWSRYWSS